MTGRDLIVYILSNGLEDESVFNDGKFIGFITVSEAAEKMNVGLETIYAWIVQGRLEHICFEGKYFITADCKLKTV